MKINAITTSNRSQNHISSFITTNPTIQVILILQKNYKYFQLAYKVTITNFNGFITDLNCQVSIRLRK